MTSKEILAVFQEALDLLNDRPNFALRRDRRRTSYKLAARMDERVIHYEFPQGIALPDPGGRTVEPSWLHSPIKRLVSSS